MQRYRVMLANIVYSRHVKIMELFLWTTAGFGEDPNYLIIWWI